MKQLKRAICVWIVASTRRKFFFERGGKWISMGLLIPSKLIIVKFAMSNLEAGNVTIFIYLSLTVYQNLPARRVKDVKVATKFMVGSMTVLSSSVESAGGNVLRMRRSHIHAIFNIRLVKRKRKWKMLNQWASESEKFSNRMNVWLDQSLSFSREVKLFY